MPQTEVGFLLEAEFNRGTYISKKYFLDLFDHFIRHLEFAGIRQEWLGGLF